VVTKRISALVVTLACACSLLAAGCAGSVSSVTTTAAYTSTTPAYSTVSATSSTASSTTNAPTTEKSQESQSPRWEDYADIDGDSGIDAYQIGPDYIRVRFDTGSVYVYTYTSAGRSDIEAMKALARSGDGLLSYIMRNAKYDYESKQP
jgi:hypothetical protein